MADHPRASWKRDLGSTWLLDAGWVRMTLHHHAATVTQLPGWVVEIHMPWGQTLSRTIHHVGGVVDVADAQQRAAELARHEIGKVRARLDEAEHAMFGTVEPFAGDHDVLVDKPGKAGDS